MFLYDNNIVSENNLSVEIEPTFDFFKESMTYNKELLAATMAATKEALLVIQENGASENIVTESFSDMKDKIIKFLKDFKVKVITLFKKWADYIIRKLGGQGLYGMKAIDTLLKDKDKCTALKDFHMVVSEPVDPGYTYFKALEYNDEIAKAMVANNYIGKVIKDILDDKTDTTGIDDAAAIRDQISNITSNFINGKKMTEFTIKDIENLHELREKSTKLLDEYKVKITKCIDQIIKATEKVAGDKTASIVENSKKLQIYTLFTTSLNEHLSVVTSKCAEYVNTIDKLIAEFLPQAEQYLLAKG